MARINKNNFSLFFLLVIVVLTLFALFCLLPAFVLITGSLTDNDTFEKVGYQVFPTVINFDAYKYILKNADEVIKGYGISLYTTILGTILNVLITCMVAFPLSMTDFKFRNKINFYFFITMLFSGGLVPYYIVVKQYLHMADTLWVLIVPAFAPPFYIFLMRTFFRDVPREIFEASKIDGCSDFGIFFIMAMPLSLPGIATLSLLIALGYWNDWYTPMIFIEEYDLAPLQLVLTRLVNMVESVKDNMTGGGMIVIDVPSQAMVMATCVIATVPILALFLFLQKYLIKGLTAGSVKG